MLQHIRNSVVPQNSQVQAAQSQDNKGIFELLMKTSVGKLDQKKDIAETAKPKSEDKDDSDQKTDPTAVQTLLTGTDTSSLATLLQQSISAAQSALGTQMTGIQTESTLVGNAIQAANALQTTNTLQVANTLQATNTLQTANAVQDANIAQVAAASQQANAMIQGSANTANLTAAQPNSNVQVVDAGKDLLAAQQLNLSSIDSAQNQVETVLAENSPLLTAMPNTTVTSQISKQNQRNVPSTLTQTVSQAEQNPADSSTKLAFSAQIQNASLSSEKEDTSNQDTASKNQNPSSFSNLFQTGNVIIQVSDKSSNAAKTVFSQVADNIESNYKAGNSKFQIDLYPQDLGKVSVKLAMQNGLLTVEISAANPKTQSMLLANSGEMKSLLQSAVSQPVQILQPSQDKAWYQQPQNQSNQSSAQQQEQQQQNKEANSLRNAQTDNISADEFLTVMQQLKQQTYLS